MDRDGRHIASGAPAILVRVALLAAVVVGLVGLLGPRTYHVPSGTVSFRLQPAWPGGRLITPLGPVGELTLRTHRTPVDVVMEYRLPSEAAALLEGGSGADLQTLQGGAREAFDHFLLTRVPWLLAAGAAAGALAAGRRSGWRRLGGLGAGAALALLSAGAFVLVSYATLDRSPSVRYAGLASRVPSILPMLRVFGSGGDQDDRLGRLQDYFDGLEAVATQMTNPPRRPARADVVRLLLVSDIHDNVFGARAAARLADGDGEPVDAVLLAGDLTDAGTAQEAQVFLRVFGRPPAPVVSVGGNHEDAPALAVFRRAGFHILDYSTMPVSGVTVLGASDPLAADPRVDSDVAALEAASARLALRWDLESPRPQVVLVHDLRQAAATVDAAREEGAQVVIAYGNDHVAGVSQDDGVVLVDAGTAGASGYEAIGAASRTTPTRGEPPPGSRDVYTYQLVDFARDDPRRLLAVTTLSYASGGRTVVTYTPFGG